MTQIHGCLRYVKALGIIWIKMVVSVVSLVHSVGIFFLFWDKKISCERFVRTVMWFIVLKHVLKTAHSLRYLPQGQLEWTEYGWRRDNKLQKTKQIWLGSSKLLKILIGDENKDTFMKYATMELSYFL